ncbi:MAG: hypothetical protein BGO21_29865 [Dyadobacter sp. 50-39]|nr:hypothetical protein [uncultured Dyadobacter sp.]OJV15214.1 MAG: hypothetical protein BGO21_29865 [Dyadobacter sp. 50-39]
MERIRPGLDTTGRPEVNLTLVVFSEVLSSYKLPPAEHRKKPGPAGVVDTDALSADRMGGK